MKSIGEIFKEERKNKGISLQQVELKTGISAAYVYRIEEGERKEPAVKIINLLANFYNLDFYKLMDLII